MSAEGPDLDAAIKNGHETHYAMARLESLMAPIATAELLPDALVQLARKMGGSLTWLDQRSAYIGLTKGPGVLPVQLLPIQSEPTETYQLRY